MGFSWARVGTWIVAGVIGIVYGVAGTIGQAAMWGPVPLGLVIVALAVANREIVTVSFDPFNAASPAFALKAPLFLLVLILVIAGVIIGGASAWLT